MKTLAVGGVPEHFNLPWRKLVESGDLRALGVDASWQDYPGGSGALGAALAEGTLDVAMLLTEGAVAGIANGGSYRIVSLYTDSPLIWGIHVPAESAFAAVDDLRGARYAISRFGSGSHLMAFAHARAMGWPVGELRFVPVGSLDGAIEAFEQGRADVFLWERVMTQPVVDAGRFRRVGEFTSPWPAFVVCASAPALDGKPAEIRIALERVFAAAAAVSSGPDSEAEIAARYRLNRADVREWLRATRWTRRVGVPAEVISTVLATLRDVGLVAAADAAQMVRAV